MAFLFKIQIKGITQPPKQGHLDARNEKQFMESFPEAIDETDFD